MPKLLLSKSLVQGGGNCGHDRAAPRPMWATYGSLDNMRYTGHLSISTALTLLRHLLLAIFLSFDLLRDVSFPIVHLQYRIFPSSNLRAESHLWRRIYPIYPSRPNVAELSKYSMTLERSKLRMRRLQLGALALATLSLASAQNYSSVDMMRTQLALMDDRPDDCPPWYAQFFIAT